MLITGFAVTDLAGNQAMAQPTETPYPLSPASFAPINYKGVNIAGAEQNPQSTRPYGYDYIYPRSVEIDYFASRGFGLLRMPINISRVQPKNLAALDPVQTGYIKAVLDYALSKNMWVVLDAHNYGYVTDSTSGASRLIGVDPSGTAIFVDFWQRLATKFMNYPNVIFGLMNEPNAQTPAQWKTAALGAHDAIRKLGIVKQMILLQGTNWDGASSWTSGSKNNGAAWSGYKADPNVAFEVHQYLDSDSSGTHPVCEVGVGSSRLVSVTGWARTNHFKLFLGEFGWSADQYQGVETNCGAEARIFMSYLDQNKDVWGGWSYWNGGSWAFYGNYMYGVQPTGSVGSYMEKPQMSILAGSLYQPY